MKKQLKLVFLIAIVLINSCNSNNEPAVISLTDPSLTNPTFSSADFVPSLAADEISISKTSTGVSLFYSYSSYLNSGIYQIDFSGSALTIENLIDSTVYQMPSVDAVYDNQYNTTRLAYFYDYPNWTDPDPIICGSYSFANLNSFEIDGRRMDNVKIAMVDELTNTYVITSNADSYILYKYVSFTGATSHVITPPYVIGSGTSFMLYDNQTSIPLRETRLAYNPNTSKTLVGASYYNASTNYFRVIDVNGPVSPYKLLNKYNNGNAPEFDIAPIGDYFLVAYSSNLNIAEQNQGSNVQCGEHVRLALLNSGGNNEDLKVGYSNPDYSLSDKAIALPQSIGLSNEVGKICLARKDNSEVGLAFVRDWKLYFTRVVWNGSRLSISPIVELDDPLPMYEETQMKMYWDGVYYIVYYDELGWPVNKFQTYIAN